MRLAPRFSENDFGAVGIFARRESTWCSKRSLSQICNRNCMRHTHTHIYMHARARINCSAKDKHYKSSIKVLIEGE